MDVDAVWEGLSYGKASWSKLTGGVQESSGVSREILDISKNLLCPMTISSGIPYH